MRPVITDIYAAAAHSGIRPGTLRQRLRRGTLTHHGYDRHGRALIDLNELVTTPTNEQHTDAA
ncbi:MULTISPECIES: hypothetical protein [Streptomyces]|uniref:DNA-binding protein n=2 Tax=Streptomyces rimosus subsp. rimosus TaxID=132474 RepID=A0A8A1UJ72_STRR1|nr:MULTISPECIES: hypothetical protein [Streptomyces]MYT44931.1 hypothetical protein [Streptomyces sp. SID5471]QDA09889.1 hypothetical protein CTZ40_29085 [Streptomyces rimosus]QEV81162.1 hypothetical protein CP984_29050 [Streptomyces rimosus]QGY70413.1 hypothetical protein V519_035115 [Streptomyces rimosus R6-500]QST80776.1 hypothetical protein SRIM_011840 [Streptomyces rimosus subsp. rimosus ATCC 10970]